MINARVRDLGLINHINNYCDEIASIHMQFGNDKKIFISNPAYEKSIAFCVLQIGELSTHLSEEFRTSHKEINWKEIRGMRNVVVHHYGDIEVDILWNTSIEDIKIIKEFCIKELHPFFENNEK